MSACTSQNYIYYRLKETKISDGSIIYRGFLWDKVNKVHSITAVATLESDFYPVSNGAIIDVIQIVTGGQTRVQIVQINYGGSQAQGYLQKVTLPSTSGDLYNELLTASVSAGVLTIKMYARIVKEVTTLTYPVQTGYTLPLTGMPADVNDGTNTYQAVGSYGTGTYANTPCFNNYSNPKNTEENPIEEYCQGFDKYTVYHDGAGGVTVAVDQNSSFCGWTDPGEGGGGEGGSPPEPLVARITENLLIKVNNGCFQSPLYMCWRNTLGGWDYWLFEKKQEYNVKTDSLGGYRENFTRISDTTNPDKEIGKTAQPTIIVGAQALSTQEKQAISQIYYSPKVYILNQDASISREVRISSGSFVITRTDSNLHDIEFEIIDAPINTIRN